jgi:hypothetical protein
MNGGHESPHRGMNLHAHVLALEKEGIVSPMAKSKWQTHHKALVPAPNKTEVLMLKSHVERGFSMPPSHFFSNLLQFYGLQLHHIVPNSLVSMAGYANTLLDSARGRRASWFYMAEKAAPN